MESRRCSPSPYVRCPRAHHSTVLCIGLQERQEQAGCFWGYFKNRTFWAYMIWTVTPQAMLKHYVTMMWLKPQQVRGCSLTLLGKQRVNTNKIQRSVCLFHADRALQTANLPGDSDSGTEDNWWSRNCIFTQASYFSFYLVKLWVGRTSYWEGLPLGRVAARWQPTTERMARGQRPPAPLLNQTIHSWIFLNEWNVEYGACFMICYS